MLASFSQPAHLYLASEHIQCLPQSKCILHNPSVEIWEKLPTSGLGETFGKRCSHESRPPNKWLVYVCDIEVSLFFFFCIM